MAVTQNTWDVKLLDKIALKLSKDFDEAKGAGNRVEIGTSIAHVLHAKAEIALSATKPSNTGSAGGNDAYYNSNKEHTPT